MFALGPSTNVKVVQIKSNLVFGKKGNHFFNELFDTYLWSFDRLLSQHYIEKYL
jgi:hypothetical protein